MNIGIIIYKQSLQQPDWYINKLILRQIIQQSPHCNYFIFTDAISEIAPLKAANSRFIFISSKLGSGWGKKILLPAAIKKHQVSTIICIKIEDVFKTSLPCYAILHQVATDLNLPKNIAGIVTTSNVVYDAMHTSVNKVILLEGFTGGHYKPISFEDKQVIKEAYTGGKEYFLCNDIDLTSDAFISLLKGFSIFKQFQLSEWKLIIFLPDKNNGDAFEKIIATYKYRNDVILLYDDDTNSYRQQLVAAAYALITLSRFTLSFFEAGNCEVPVTAWHNDELKKYTGAYVTVEEVLPQLIAEKMMHLYKKENFKNKYIAKATETLLQFQPQQGFEALLQLLCATQESPVKS